ncbi:c-type cytochrome [Tatumella citrea]|uniref:Alcohol dehydrogenase n=1 Tax=Tatumella citrea TaxID=53336 RepID=A0A1Y0L7U9_TATCI|nr:cytochrome c [Tatumella citrea]ARU93759.1 alcohol dehydrogenase [Tatumella citrea]ARU97797.1 alcohol dehydrogenase [Tatumella citrea]
MKTIFVKLLPLAIMSVIGVIGLKQAYADSNDSADLIKQGAYLARAGDCTACHTEAGGKPFAGGLAIRSPMGVIYSTNITPDKNAGIGSYTEQQFAEAVRKGVRRDGSNLYPAMPYPDYSGITDKDIHALYVYFMHGVAPVSVKAPQTSLTFPFSLRWGMKFWNIAFASGNSYPPAPTTQSDSADAQALSRGRYLVDTLGHCSSCHTPRGIGMQEKALNDSDSRFLSSGMLNDWTVPSLRNPDGWSVNDIAEYLSTGRNDFASVGGEMTGVVQHSMQHMNQADLHAIALYLKSLPASTKQQHNVKPDLQNDTQKTVDTLTLGKNLNSGQMLYLNNCEACHLTDGGGAKKIFPRLNGASIVLADNPTGLISVMLKGAQTPSTANAPSVQFMPGFEQRLNDQQIAELASFVRSGWGNNAPPVSAADVAKVRASLNTSQK